MRGAGALSNATNGRRRPAKLPRSKALLNAHFEGPAGCFLGHWPGEANPAPMGLSRRQPARRMPRLLAELAKKPAMRALESGPFEQRLDLVICRRRRPFVALEETRQPNTQ